MYSLYLYATTSTAQQLTATDLPARLAEHGIIDRPGRSHTHPAGKRLMEFINFLGCSPVVADGSADSLVHIHCFDGRGAMGGDSVDAIRYPGCGHIIDHPALLIDNFPSQIHWRCPICANNGVIEDINWRKSAGFGDCFIEISGIFPKEALPTDGLLTILKTASQTNWQWFYSRTSDAIDHDL